MNHNLCIFFWFVLLVHHFLVNFLIFRHLINNLFFMLISDHSLLLLYDYKRVKSQNTLIYLHIRHVLREEMSL